jgi:hypothetical protein
VIFAAGAAKPGSSRAHAADPSDILLIRCCATDRKICREIENQDFDRDRHQTFDPGSDRHHPPIKRLHPVSNFDSWSTQLIRCQNASLHTGGVLAPTPPFSKNDAPGVQLICSSESAKFTYFRIILIQGFTFDPGSVVLTFAFLCKSRINATVP